MINLDWSGEAHVVVVDPGRRNARDRLPAIDLVNGVVPQRDPEVKNPTWLLPHEWCWAVALASRQYAIHQLRVAVQAMGASS
jgi:hypothetical protein